MSVRILRGNERVDAIGSDDRGLNYGDGLFETMLVHAGVPVWWSTHWQRLARGAQRLGIALPDEQVIRSEAQSLCAREAHAVLKLVLTRGGGGRGYAPPADARSTCILSLHAPPPAAPERVALRWCDTPLAVQPLLAGLKHLNRLEQVLARAEWNDPEVFEGLMCDTAGRVICATAANVFARIDGVWRTPDVSQAGVAGILRDWLLANDDRMEVTVLGPETIESADAVFLCNAVRGILPVARLGTRHWPVDPVTTDLRRRLAAAHPAFVFQE